MLGRFMNVGGEDIGYKWGKLNMENMVLSGKNSCTMVVLHQKNRTHSVYVKVEWPRIYFSPVFLHVGITVCH